ncbi:O-methyltransferase [Cyathus striatus]|nr:O-methyltransferase [Cyathus striatus]
MTFKDIRLLRGILNDALDHLEVLYTSQSLDFPSLNNIFDVSSPNEALYTDQLVCSVVDTIVASAYQLLCTVRQPFASLSDISNAHHLSACLRVAENLNIPEILRDADPNGMHVIEIGMKVGVDHNKMGRFISYSLKPAMIAYFAARILRVLTTHHIFQEIKPDVFTNNRISSFFDTGIRSDLHLIKENPEKKYRKDAGMAGYIGTVCDEVAKASSYLLEHLTDPSFGSLYLANKTPLQHAFRTEKEYFSWLELSDNTYRLERYAACIQGTSLWDPPESILNGYDWESLPVNSLVVDVGGGTGVPTMALAKAHTNLRFCIQDRGPVIEQAKKYWNDFFPTALENGRVNLQVHDFFEHQNVHDADIFLLRTVCHDWPDSIVIKILTRLRAAANNSTRLVIGDFIMPFSCPDQSVADQFHEELDYKRAPYPILSNFGKARSTAYFVDMTMLVLLNGQERSLPWQKRLITTSGWRVTTINRIHNSFFGYLIAEPAQWAHVSII